MYRKLKNSVTCFDSQRRQRQSEEEAGIGSAAAIISSVSGAIESDRVQLAQEREFCRLDSQTTMHSFGRKPSKVLLSTDDEYDSDDSFGSSYTENEISSDETPNWITIEDGKGGIQHIQTRLNQTESQDGDENGRKRFNREDSTHIEKPCRGEIGGSEISIHSYKGKRRKRKRMSNGEEQISKGIPSSDKSYPYTITALLKRELRGRGFFSMEPNHDAHSHSKRIVSKKGIVHTERSHVSKRKRRYLSDFFNTMLDIKWRFVLLIFTLSFFLSWWAFAVIWWIIMWIRSDFEPDHLPDMQAKNGYIPCVLAIHNFASVFLFSVETQHTIGYGSRQTTERCAEAIFLQSLQSVVGVMIQACMVGTIFAKLSRPKKRAQTLLFTKNAIVCKRDGKLCLIFRVGNMRYTSLVEAHVRAIYIGKRVTEEGEVIPYDQREMKVGVDAKGEEDTILFLWPTSIVHVIDEDSPFYNMTASDLLRKRYEVIVVLEGISEPTGMSIQARSSYMPNEILWGYRFLNVLNYRKTTNQYKIDYSAFNKVVKVDTPRCSAKQLEEESDESDSSPQKSPTIVKVFPSPITQPSLSPSDLKAKFFQSNITIPYHQSQAALTPPYSNSPLRGAVGINSDIGSPSHTEKGGLSAGIRSSRRSDRLSRNPIASETSHLSMPCLHQVKIADSQPNLQSAISAQYKKALGKW